MRERIIGWFGAIVVIVGVLSALVVHMSIGDLSNSGESRRAVISAVSHLQVEGLRIERWLAAQVSDEGLLDAFDMGAI